MINAILETFFPNLYDGNFIKKETLVQVWHTLCILQNHSTNHQVHELQCKIKDDDHCLTASLPSHILYIINHRNNFLDFLGILFYFIVFLKIVSFNCKFLTFYKRNSDNLSYSWDTSQLYAYFYDNDDSDADLAAMERVKTVAFL